MNTQRSLRVSEQILHYLPALIRQQTDFEGLFITITEVNVSADLREAHVFLSILNSDRPPQYILPDLQHYRHSWQQQLGKVLQTKFTPCLIFHINEQKQQKAERVLNILDELDRSHNRIRDF
jgi:ribosome-binding factor A